MTEDASLPSEGPLVTLSRLVDEVYHFRDHFFETHRLEEANTKASLLKAREADLLSEFCRLEVGAVEENRAQFLLLKGRMLNVSGDFSNQAETLLSS